MSVLTAIAGWLLAQGIRAADWLLQDIGTGRGEVAEAPKVYIPPSVAEQFKSITDEMGDLPRYEQLADLYLIPEETR